MLRCTGCGSTETVEQIRAKHPDAISCCPERNMQERCAASSAAAKKLYEHIALQGNTVTITDVEAGYLARLLDNTE